MSQTKIMAILNMTPDSLYASVLRKPSGEQHLRKHLEAIIKAGADIIDVGGESTGPGSSDVSAGEEFKRIEPALAILEELKTKHEFLISVDTYKAQVLDDALKYRVDILNDVTALRGDPLMAGLVATSGIKVCLMYMAVELHASGNNVRTNNEVVHYKNVVQTISDFWKQRITYAKAHGIKDEQIILDPGMGAFVSGNPKYSFEILDRLGELKKQFSSYPILIGASRKGFLSNGGKLTVTERLEPSLAAAKRAVQNGAEIIRTHDVGDTIKYLENVDN